MLQPHGLKAIKYVYPALQILLACTLVRRYVNSLGGERSNYTLVWTVDQIEVVRSELLQGPFGENPTENNTQERTSVFVLLRQWFDCRLNLLYLIPRVLGVSAPSNFNKCSWLTYPCSRTRRPL